MTKMMLCLAVCSAALTASAATRAELAPGESWPYMVVVSRAAAADPAWRAVADALSKKYAAAPFRSSLVVVDPTDAAKDLRDAAPRYVAFVVKPEEAASENITALHSMMRSLDDDPHYDAVWGIVTGPDAAAAMRVATAAPIHPRKALTTTGVELAPFDDVTTISDAYAPGFNKGDYSGPAQTHPCAIIEKRGSAEPASRIVRGDTTEAFVRAWNELDPELLVTSSHASQRNLEMPFSTGNIISRGGVLRPLPGKNLIDRSTGKAADDRDESGAGEPLAAPKCSKICIAAGNCFIGDYQDNESMAAALIGYGHVVQFMGYTRATWFGEIGWETLEQFMSRGATVCEAWYFAGQNLTRKLFSMGEDFNNVKYLGRLWDGEGTAFWGDPALDARLDASATNQTARLSARRVGRAGIQVVFEALADIPAAEDKINDVRVEHPFGMILPCAECPYICEGGADGLSLAVEDDFLLVTGWPAMTKGDKIVFMLYPGPEIPVVETLAHDVEFLVKHTPPQYEPVPGDFVTNNCLLAAWARRTAPEMYPDEIYLDYVLPYSVIREERDDWRSEFRTRFAPMVAAETNAYNAAVMLDRKIWDVINVHYNVGRDKARQSPRHSMRIHMASCTGISIILIDTCRALGIPARLVGCNWTTIPGNHSWVEIWSEGAWHVLASGEKERENDIWFLDYAEKADVSRQDKRIYASRWSPSPEGTLFWQTWEFPQKVSDVPADDVTRDYLPGGRAARR